MPCLVLCGFGIQKSTIVEGNFFFLINLHLYEIAGDKNKGNILAQTIDSDTQQKI